MVEKNLKYKHILNCFSNYFVKNGKKKNIFFLFFKFLKNKKKKKKLFKNIFLFFFIITKVRPVVELKVIRKGSKYYTFPTPYKKYKSFRVGLKWISDSIKQRLEYSLQYRIRREFFLILRKEGLVWKKVKELQKKASENMIYAHYRWR
jgi:ribosomal protein S7